MTSQNGALPNVVVNVEPQGVSGTSTAAEAAKIVQGVVLKRAPASRWKWTKKKKEALRLLMQGAAIVEVAEKVKAHRNSLTLWMKHPEWLAEAQRYVSESQMATKLRRLKTTSIIADKLASKSIQALSEDGPMNVGETGLVLREHISYVKAERDLYGEGQADQPSGPGTTLNIHLGAPGQPQPVDTGLAATSLMAFKDFMSKYDPNLAVVAHSPQEAAALVAERVLQESNLLDTIREEDRAVLKQEAEAAETAKRKR